MESPLAGRTVAVTGTGGPLGGPLATSLEAAGAAVRRVEGPGPDGIGGGPLDGLVVAWVAPDAVRARRFEEVGDDLWDAAWERTMTSTVAVLQAAHATMAGRGGRIVVVVPTVGMSGGAGLVPLAAGSEGQRVLVKSAARQWGPDGLTVNAVAVAPETVLDDPEEAPFVSLAPPALGTTGDVGTDVASVVVTLLGDGGGFLTGLTLTADGGTWMSP